MKKISILLTNKNQGDKLYSCMECLVNQTYPNLEILVLDAGYKNEGINYVKELQINYSNIFIYEKKYASLNALRKLGISKATGDYILFMLPDDILNYNAISVLADCIEKEEADIAIGGFFHPYYNNYLENVTYDLTHIDDFMSYQRDVFSNSMLTGKLYKKNLFEELKFKDIYLNEVTLHLQFIKKAKKIVTTEKMLFVTKEHSLLFENTRFWENQQSFWYKAQETLNYQIKFFKTNKKLCHKMNETELTNLRALDYLIWELLVYANFATVESLTMELFQILKNETMNLLLSQIPSDGLIWKTLDENTFLANCILYADLLVKKITSLQEKISQINIIKICFMIFLKLFYRQTSTLNTQYFLCRVREELNLNESKEAKFVNGLNL